MSEVKFRQKMEVVELIRWCQSPLIFTLITITITTTKDDVLVHMRLVIGIFLTSGVTNNINQQSQKDVMNLPRG